MPYDAVKDFAPITLVADHAQRAGGQPVAAGQLGQGADRLRQGESRQAVVRLGQQRQRRSSRRRAVQGRHGHRHGARPVQGRRAGDAGAARRRHAVHVRQSRQRDAAGEGGQAQGARGDDRQALEARARPADDGRGRVAGLRHLDVVRPARARRHAGGHHRQVERRRDARS